MKQCSTTAAALFLGCAAAVCSMASPVQWAGNGHWYEVWYSQGVNWVTADWYAANVFPASIGHGGYLATLTSPAEDAFVASIIRPEQEFWIGGFQDPQDPATAFDPGAGWTWVNGEGPLGYSNWSGGEPNDAYGPGSEQYLAINRLADQKWNDEGNLGLIQGYIVEYQCIPDAGSTLSLMGLAMIGVASLRRRLG